MKIVTASNGKKIIKMSKNEWMDIGKKAGWKVIALHNPALAWFEQLQFRANSTKNRAKMSQEEKKTLFAEYSGLMKQIAPSIQSNPRLVKDASDLIGYLNRIILFPKGPIERDYTGFFIESNNSFVAEGMKLVQQQDQQQTQQTNTNVQPTASTFVGKKTGENRIIEAEWGVCPNCRVKTVTNKDPEKARKGQKMCPKCKADYPQTPYEGSWADEEKKKRENKNASLNKKAVIQSDGIADGGEPYTDEEMDLMEKQDKKCVKCKKNQKENGKDTCKDCK